MSNLKPLQAVHKKFLKLLLGIPAYNHDRTYEDIVLLANSLSIDHTYILNASSLLFVNQNENLLINIPKIEPSHSTRTTRLNPRFHVPSPQLSTTQRFIHTRLPKLLNAHPEIQIHNTTKNMFITQLKNALVTTTQ